MQCCVPLCKNDSEGDVCKSQGITFHKFPTKPNYRKTWLKALDLNESQCEGGRFVCSEHFCEDDFFMTRKGSRQLKANAAPLIIQYTLDSNVQEYDEAENQVQKQFMTCRICLNTECKQFALEQYKLKEIYQNLTGLLIQDTDKLPRTVCFECAQRLLNYDCFREKSLRAEMLLSQLVEKHASLTMYNILMIDRKNFQLTSNLIKKTFDPNHYDFHIKQLTENEIEIEVDNDLKSDSDGKEMKESIAYEYIEVNSDPNVISDCEVKKEKLEDNELAVMKCEIIPLYDEKLTKEVKSEKTDVPSTKVKRNVTRIGTKNTEDDSLNDNSDADDESDFDVDKYASSDDTLELEWKIKRKEFTKTLNNVAKVLRQHKPMNDVNKNNIDDSLKKAKSSNTTLKRKNAKEIKKSAIKKSKINNDKDNSNNDTSENSLAMEVSVEEKGGNVKKRKRVRLDGTQFRRQIYHGHKPFITDDVNEVLFTIKELSLEEQVAEMRSRQGSAKYLSATFKCTVCYLGFLDGNAFDKHMTRHTKETGEFECEVCKYHYKSLHLAKKHKKARHETKFTCNLCPFITTHREFARIHGVRHRGTKYHCPHCADEFLKYTLYLDHITINHTPEYICTLCGNSFIEQEESERHKRLRHEEDEEVRADGPLCERCGVRFASDAAHKRHLQVSIKHNSDSFSKELTVKKREPMKSVSLPYKKKTTPPSSIDCEKCGEKLQTYREYHAHFRKNHPGENRTNYPISTPKIMCELCGKLFTSVSRYRDHSYTHTNERTFTCEPCGKSFAQKALLQNHFHRMHSGARVTHTCKMCNKTLSTLQNLQRHMLTTTLFGDHRWVHTNERPFRCEHCGKCFAKRALLRNHYRLHKEERVTYLCKLCDKEYSTLHNLQRHIQSHTGEKRFKCEICGRRFKTKNEKQSHYDHIHMKKPWPKRPNRQRPISKPRKMTSKDSAFSDESEMNMD